MAERTWPVWGHAPAVRYLLSQLEQNRISSSYIFVGPSAVGKRTTARIFLQTALCLRRVRARACGACPSCRAWEKGMHPDAQFLEKGQGSIEDVRSLKRHLALRPVLSSFRTALIRDADALTNEAKNGLLKLLEEPPEQTILVLCASALDYLPLTIRSRCHTVSFDLVPKHIIADLLGERTDDEQRIREVSSLAAGRPGLAIAFLEAKDELQWYYDRVHQLLEMIERPFGERVTMQSTFSGQPLLDLFLWTYRDIMLFQTRNPDLCMHTRFRERYEQLATRYAPSQILHALRRVLRAKELLARNISPTAAFDYSLLAI